MIYFLDNSLQLQKIVTSKNVISAIHEHELNGLIRADVELDLSYANKFLILGIDHVGYYYKDEFYLHKIQRVEYDHVNETATVVLRHIFFEDMLFGKLIRDVRPQNQDALQVSRQTIDANTRWQTIMTDVTGRLSTNFYWQVPYEVIEFMTENYRIEYLPKILFDGKKINGFQLHLANKIGEDKNIRIPYGSRVLDLKYEEDYSEIITKLVVHGKGEEVGDGYGRRINISDVNFSRNGVKSPVGSLYLEDESITNTYGNDGQTPREGREVFEDIEDASELAEAGYQHYLQVSRPQMLFTADVADIGDVGIGDSVMIIRREYDVYFNARIHKLSVDLLYPEDAQVELGDYKHFKESKISRKTREKNNRVQGQLSDRITRLKREADERFDSEVGQWRSEYEQALIDVHAEIEADRENMTNLIEGTRAEFTDNLNAEITQTKEYAELQAQAKADEVRTDLETVTFGHQQMLDDLESNVINIDEFLGDSREVTLDERFFSINENFEERIRRVDSNTFNMLRGTQLDEPDVYSLFTGATLYSSERINFVNVMTSQSSWTAPRVRFEHEVRIEAGKKYIFAVEYRTDSVPELDWFRIQREDGLTNLIPYSDGELLSIKTDGEWNRAITEFTFGETITGKFEIGTYYASGDGSREPLHIRLPYLTSSENTEWVYHPLDATQNISEVVRRVTNLEDGYSELTTRSEFDFATGKLDQQMKSVYSTVEGSQTVLQRLEDWEATNGAAISETVYGFDQKVWLNDVANIGANLIPRSENAWEDGTYWSGSGVDNNDTSRIRIKRENAIPVVKGEKYTFSDDSNYWSRLSTIDIFQYEDGEYVGQSGWHLINRGGTLTFTALGNEILIGLRPPGLSDWTDLPLSMLSDAEYPIRIKLEKGAAATPMLNAISRIEQLANSVAIQVQGLDGDYLSQSDLEITPDYWQLGSMRIGAEDVSSVLRGSPDAIDAVVSEFNLTGNLNAKGQITSLAVDAIEGNFARLFSSELTANIITSDHIQVGTALVDKMFATSARIDELITKTHFVNEMHALTLNVVDLNASEIRTRLLTANTIEAEWLKGGTALIDRLFSSTAMFERMMAKSGFVNTLNTVSLHANSFSSSIPGSNREITMENGRARFRYGSIEIQTTSGRRVIIDGSINRSSSMTQRMPAFMSSAVSINGSWYQNDSSSHQVAHTEYYMHEARHLLVGVALNRWGYANQGAYARMSTRGITSSAFSVTSDGTHYGWLEIDLGEPLDRPTTGEVQISFRKTNSSIAGAVRLHIANRYVTDYPDNR